MKRFSVLVIFLCGYLLFTQIVDGQRADIRRDRSAAIVGRVIDTNEAPVSANLMVYAQSIVDGHLNISAMCSTFTDSDGKYECRGLPPGRYLVCATAKESPPVHSGSTRIAPAFSRTFYPAAFAIADASIVQLDPGITGLANVVMQSGLPGSLTGHLSARPYHPTIVVKTRFGAFDLPIQADTEYDPVTGAFVIAGLPRGTYSVSVDWWDSGRMRNGYGIADVVPGIDEKIIISDVERHAVSGSVHLVNDNLEQPALPTSVELIGLAQHAGWQLDAKVASDGSFAFPEIVDGDYVLRTSVGSATFVSSITTSGRSIPGDVLQLRPGTLAIDLDVDLSLTRATVTGMLDADGFLPGKSAIVLESEEDHDVTVVTPDSNRAFIARNLPPGNYRLFAWSSIEDAEYRNAAELARLKKNSTEIHVDNDSHLTGVELILIPSGS